MHAALVLFHVANVQIHSVSFMKLNDQWLILAEGVGAAFVAGAGEGRAGGGAMV